MTWQLYSIGSYYVLEALAWRWYKAISPGFADIEAALVWQRENETFFPEGRFTGRWAGSEWEDVVCVSGQ